MKNHVLVAVGMALMAAHRIAGLLTHDANPRSSASLAKSGISSKF